MPRHPEPEQRDPALRNANIVRQARSALRLRVVSGEVALADVLRDPPGGVLTARVFQVLKWQRSWGEDRALKFLSGVPIPWDKTVGSLTPRQRGVLADRLEAERR